MESAKEYSPQTIRFVGLETSLSTVKISEAMAKFQMEVEQPKKDKNNPFYGSKYVPFENVVACILKAAPKNGLSYIQWATKNEKGQVGISTRINHSSGEFFLFDPVYESVAQQKSQIQAAGSVQSYLRRYSLSAAFGMASEDDDDGNSDAELHKDDKTPAQLKYEENQRQKKALQAQNGSQNNSQGSKGQSNQKSPQTLKNENKADEHTQNFHEDPKPEPKKKEPATKGQIKALETTIKSIANKFEIPEKDVYKRFQLKYEIETGKKNAVPEMDKLNKEAAEKMQKKLLETLNTLQPGAGLPELPVEPNPPASEDPKTEEGKEGEKNE